MTARPIPLNHLKRSLKRKFELKSASALFDEHVSAVYDCESLSADDYAELRKKLKNAHTSVVLVQMKN
jgi:ribosomal protein L10